MNTSNPTRPHLRRWAALAAGLLAALVAGCGESSEGTPTGSSKSTPDVVITEAMASRCPALSARALDNSTTPAVSTMLEVSTPTWIEYRVYSRAGYLQGSGQAVVGGAQLQGVSKVQVTLGWDLKDAWGNPVPTGHYFFFVDQKDTTGKNLIHSEVVCVGVKSSH